MQSSVRILGALFTTKTEDERCLRPYQLAPFEDLAKVFEESMASGPLSFSSSKSSQRKMEMIIQPSVTLDKMEGVVKSLEVSISESSPNEVEIDNFSSRQTSYLHLVNFLHVSV